ncbi:MAG: TonB-dependent receptor [Longimicrobiales bacterium]
MTEVLRQTLRTGFSLDQLDERLADGMELRMAVEEFVVEYVNDAVRYPRIAQAHLHDPFVKGEYPKALLRGFGGALLQNRSSERELRLRNVNRVRLGERSSLEIGIEAKRTDADYDNAYASHVGPLGDTIPSLRVDADVGASKLAAFASWTMSASPRFTATLGARVDRFSYNGAIRESRQLTVNSRQ